MEHVLERVADGELLKVILAPPEMPHRATWWRWVREDPELERRWKLARDMRADSLAEDSVHVADEGAKRGEDPRNTGFRVRSRQWLAAREAPARYGDRLEHAVGDATGKTLADVLVAARARRAQQEGA